MEIVFHYLEIKNIIQSFRLRGKKLIQAHERKKRKEEVRRGRDRGEKGRGEGRGGEGRGEGK